MTIYSNIQLLSYIHTSFSPADANNSISHDSVEQRGVRSCSSSCMALPYHFTSSIEIATRAADQFTRLYYSAYDSPNRITDLPNFYRPTSAVTWNGNPFTGADGVKDIISTMPNTKHEVQCFDCQPIPGISSFSYATRQPIFIYIVFPSGSQPPHLLVTVSGTVTHGKPHPNPNPKAKNTEGQPRVFSQTFTLMPDPAAPPGKTGEVAKYYISSDAMRFVG
jgi:NTF2-related export protein 1/2